jgi:acyl carrier protein
MKKSEFFAEIAEILGTSVDNVVEQASLEELGWDSLADVAFLGFVDEKFNLNPSPKSISACIFVRDLVILVGESVINDV